MSLSGDGGLQTEVQRGVREADGEEQAVPETAGSVRLSAAAEHGGGRGRKRRNAATTQLQHG